MPSHSLGMALAFYGHCLFRLGKSMGQIGDLEYSWRNGFAAVPGGELGVFTLKLNRGFLVVGLVAASSVACSGGSFFGGTSGKNKKAAVAESADAEQVSNIEEMENMPARDYFEQTNAMMQEVVGDGEYEIDGIVVSNLASTYSELLEKSLDSGMDGLTVKDLLGEFTEAPSDEDLLTAIEEVYGKYKEPEPLALKLKMAFGLQASSSASATVGGKTATDKDTGTNSSKSSVGVDMSDNRNVAALSGMSEETGQAAQQKAYASYGDNKFHGGLSYYGYYGHYGYGIWGTFMLATAIEAFLDYWDDRSYFNKHKGDNAY